MDAGQSMDALPTPQVEYHTVDSASRTAIAACVLRWPSHVPSDTAWHLPGGLTLAGALPERFGVTIRRRHIDDYALHLVWDEMFLTWQSLSRDAIRASALAPMLSALGQDLDGLLDQPVVDEPVTAQAAA